MLSTSPRASTLAAADSLGPAKEDGKVKEQAKGNLYCGNSPNIQNI